MAQKGEASALAAAIGDPNRAADVDGLVADALADGRASFTGEAEAALALLRGLVVPAMEEVLARHKEEGMALPLVLRSAERAARAVRFLAARCDPPEAAARGTVVLATLPGDAHDTARFQLHALLAATGFRVVDLGREAPVGTVVQAVMDARADALALSALFAGPSSQMPRCVQALAGRGLSVPVLIGGAGITPDFVSQCGRLPGGEHYRGGAIYCRDVFDGVSAVAGLVAGPVPATGVGSADPGAPERPPAARPAAPEPAEQGRAAAAQGPVPLAPVPVPRPATLGVRRLNPPLAEVWAHLDRNTLFRFHWGAYRLRGEAYDRYVADELEPELARQQALAEREGWLEARIVTGTFACVADGDELVLRGSPSSEDELGRMRFPRQRGGERRCLADYFRSRESEEPDVVVLQAVSVGPASARHAAELLDAGRYEEMQYASGLSAATAEALADWAHDWARAELGLAAGRGLRYSWGYPACPDLAQQRLVLALLGAEERIGLRLTESLHLDPEHSTCALVVHHPRASYFAP